MKKASKKYSNTSSIPGFSSRRLEKSWKARFVQSFQKPSIQAALRRSSIRKQHIIATVGDLVPGYEYIYGECHNIRPSSEEDAIILLENFDLLTSKAKWIGEAPAIAVLVNGFSKIALINLGISFSAPAMEVR
ncbi:hypothetical protein F7734_51910 [Scytonema sp. UIC 10036]|uniref:hypothetical protein n=1 Tax=Scytonema sp. UIC 10036 TaxID=2304196 RepID=UPI0012DA90D9|nr:hypothetical protein [Scytonema sp. UIC 10036]MUH00332.1 hypothetical protein [Scytonema sp. UIC 10036]